VPVRRGRRPGDRVGARPARRGPAGRRPADRGARGGAGRLRPRRGRGLRRRGGGRAGPHRRRARGRRGAHRRRVRGRARRRRRAQLRAARKPRALPDLRRGGRGARPSREPAPARARGQRPPREAMRLPAFIGRSIRRKTMVVVLATVFVTLLVNAAALLATELRAYREARLDEVRTQAEVIGHATAAALAFGDNKEATEALANLRAREDILAAALYRSDGSLFAVYALEGNAALLPGRGGLPGAYTEGDVLHVTHAILEGDQAVGTIHLVAHTQLTERIVTYLGILAGVMALALGVALALSSWFERVLTAPILDIDAAARRVVQRRDFAVRARRTTDD